MNDHHPVSYDPRQPIHYPPEITGQQRPAEYLQLQELLTLREAVREQEERLKRIRDQAHFVRHTMDEFPGYEGTKRELGNLFNLCLLKS